MQPGYVTKRLILAIPLHLELLNVNRILDIDEALIIALEKIFELSFLLVLQLSLVLLLLLFVVVPIDDTTLLKLGITFILISTIFSVHSIAMSISCVHRQYYLHYNHYRLKRDQLVIQQNVN